MKKTHGLTVSVVSVGNFIFTLLLNYYLGSMSANILALIILLITAALVFRHIDKDGWVEATSDPGWEGGYMLSSVLYIVAGTVIAISWVMGGVANAVVVLYLSFVLLTSIYYYNKSSGISRLVNETPK